MSTKHTMEGVPTMVIKGAVDVLLDRMTQIQIGDEVRPMTEKTAEDRGSEPEVLKRRPPCTGICI